MQQAAMHVLSLTGASGRPQLALQPHTILMPWSDNYPNHGYEQPSGPRCVLWGPYSDFWWPINDLHVLVLKETPSGSGCVGWNIILEQDKVVLGGGSYPWKETLLQHTPVHLLVHIAVQHNQLTFSTIVKSSPWNDRWTDNNICSLHIDINVPLTQTFTHSSLSVSVMQLESWLVDEDIVSPVADVPNTMTPATTMHLSRFRESCRSARMISRNQKTPVDCVVY